MYRYVYSSVLLPVQESWIQVQFYLLQYKYFCTVAGGTDEVRNQAFFTHAVCMPDCASLVSNITWEVGGSIYFCYKILRPI